MGTFIWMIVGIILLTITIFVHKHTYWKEEYWDGKYGKYCEKEHKMPLPVWLVIPMAITAFVPVANIIVFALGLMAYGLYRCDPPAGVTPYFRCELRWYKALIGFLTKEV
jgi:heme/copper-type cytochrome/quinol oxidase subunit 2